MSRGIRTALAVAGVAASYLVVRSPQLAARERAVAAAMRRPRGRGFDRVVGAGTDLGSLYAVAGAGVVLYASGRRRAATDLVLAGSAGWMASQALKLAVGRPRPYEAEEVERIVAPPTGSSWPSGHPAVAGAAIGSLAPHLGPTGRAVGAMIAALVAASRVYVGVHYPSDVVAGLGIGALTARVTGALRSP